MAEFRDLAIDKINDEIKNFNSTDQKSKAVKTAVADALIGFCRQADEFAQAIFQNEKTLSDCCTQIMKGVGSSISDIEVFKKAVKFYFSTADIRVDMTIDLCGNIGSADKPKGKIINLSIDDLF